MKMDDSASTPQIPSTGITFSAIALLSILALSTNLYLSLLKNQALYESKLNSIKQQVNISFEQSVSQLNSQFSLLIDHYKNMPTHISAMRENRRTDLYNLTINDYRALRQKEPHLYVMHYFDTKNITILRMHKPQSFGDDLSKIRPIVAHVNRTQSQANGFEVGKNGITYRVTTPVFDNQNNHIGALEFGIKLDYFVEHLSKWFDLRSQVLVKSTSLKNLSFKDQYKNQQREHTIIYEDGLFKNNFEKAKIKDNIYHYKNKTYLLIDNIELRSFDGNPIVKFNLLKDVTQFYEHHNNQVQFQIYFNLIVFLLFLFALYWILNNYKNHFIKVILKLKKSELKQQFFKESSEKDDLTGALNRRSWNLQLTRFLNDTEPKDKIQNAILFFDVDHFKDVNDKHGHLVGDNVLQQLSKVVKQEFRAHDNLYRWGGEEFCLLLPNTTLKQAEIKAEHLRKCVENSNWPENIKITISLGVTQIQANDTLTSIQNRMDHLMYQAKSNGRNCYVSDNTTEQHNSY